MYIAILGFLDAKTDFWGTAKFEESALSEEFYLNLLGETDLVINLFLSNSLIVDFLIVGLW